MTSFSDEELDSVLPDYSDLLEGDVSGAEERPDQVEFYQRGINELCGYLNKEGFICERLPGHKGHHMLTPGRFPSNEIQIWDDSGSKVTSDYGLLVEDPVAEFPEDSADWCGHNRAASGGEMWACERFADHEGLHMLRPGLWPHAPCQSWDDDGNCMDGKQQTTELLGDEDAEAVQRGIEFLDQQQGNPDWLNEIDLDSLNESHKAYCVLGQLYGNWDNTMETLFENRDVARSLGFYSNDGPKYTTLWREALYERKMQGALERCRRGYDLLNEKLGPGWSQEIDLDRHDESEGETSVLALVYGDADGDTGISELFDGDWDAAGQFGFYDEAEEYALLNEAWKRVFAERRSS